MKSVVGNKVNDFGNKTLKVEVIERVKGGIEIVKYKGFFKRERVVVQGIYNVKSIKFYEKETVKNGSVLGRGAAGGLLFGGAGAVVGGMSAVNAKKNVEKYLLIEYGDNEVLLYDISNPILNYNCETLNVEWAVK